MSKKYEGKYIVRCDRAGVFYGEIEGVEGNVVSMHKVRKLWMWSGAAAVEQLAKEGPGNPRGCKFTVVIDRMEVMGPIQIIPCTEEAAARIERVTEWRA